MWHGTQENASDNCRYFVGGAAFYIYIAGHIWNLPSIDRVDSRPGGINEQKDSSNPASRCTHDGRVEHNRELD